MGELADFGINPQVMKGFDGYQNVLMTGYYSPVIHARRTPQGQYNQPIYALPTQKTFLSCRNLRRRIERQRLGTGLQRLHD